MLSLRALVDRVTDSQQLSHREILFTAISALVALILIAVISNKLLLGVDSPFIVASMGASAVLLFAVPSSPMNSPWAVVVGHLSSAVIGVTCSQYIDSIILAAPIAGATAILVMLYLRCLHPPGGATAMLIVLGGDHVHATGYQFILTPIALNILILLSATLVIRRITGALRQSERGEVTIARVSKLEQSRALAPRLTEADIVAARAQLDTYIDVKDEQLLQLLRLATHNSHQRRLGDLRCQALMLPAPLCAEFGTPLAEVWGWFQQHHVTAVPVIDRARHVIGIITVHDFIRHAAEFSQVTLEERIAALIHTTHQLTSDKPEVAGQIMTTAVVTARQDARVAELLPLLDNRHIHHIPIVDTNDKLSGLLSRSEIVALLERDEVPL